MCLIQEFKYNSANSENGESEAAVDEVIMRNIQSLGRSGIQTENTRGFYM